MTHEGVERARKAVEVESELSGGLGRSWFSPVDTGAIAGFAIGYNAKASVALLAWKMHRTTARALSTGRGECLLGFEAPAAGALRSITEYTLGFATRTRP